MERSCCRYIFHACCINFHYGRPYTPFDRARYLRVTSMGDPSSRLRGHHRRRCRPRMATRSSSRGAYLRAVSFVRVRLNVYGALLRARLSLRPCAPVSLTHSRRCLWLGRKEKRKTAGVPVKLLLCVRPSGGDRRRRSCDEINDRGDAISANTRGGIL